MYVFTNPTPAVPTGFCASDAPVVTRFIGPTILNTDVGKMPPLFNAFCITPIIAK